MTKWGEQDPEAAAQWLASLPDDAESKPAAEGLALAWASYDEFAASTWAASLPAGPSRDAAAASLSYSFARDQPDEAWQWASSISDSAERDECLVQGDPRCERNGGGFRVGQGDARFSARWRGLLLLFVGMG